MSHAAPMEIFIGSGARHFRIAQDLQSSTGDALRRARGARLVRKIRVGLRDIPQPGFRASQYQRQPIVIRWLVEIREAQAFEQIVETRIAVVAQQSHRRHIERMRERLVRRHGTAEGAVEILGREAAELRGDIGHQHARQQLAAVEHRRVEKGLQDAARAARSLHDIDGQRARTVRGPVRIAHVREHRRSCGCPRSRPRCCRCRGRASSSPCSRTRAIAARCNGASSVVWKRVTSRMPAPQRFEQMRRIVRQRARRGHQRLRHRKFQILRGQRALLPPAAAAARRVSAAGAPDCAPASRVRANWGAPRASPPRPTRAYRARDRSSATPPSRSPRHCRRRAHGSHTARAAPAWNSRPRAGARAASRRASRHSCAAVPCDAAGAPASRAAS